MVSSPAMPGTAAAGRHWPHDTPTSTTALVPKEAQHVGQIGEQIDLVDLAALDQTAVNRGSATRALGANEHEVLAIMHVLS
jgi:hypothetical protein